MNIPMVSKNGPKITRSIRFDESDLKKADRLGIDVSELVRDQLKEAIKAKELEKKN